MIQRRVARFGRSVRLDSFIPKKICPCCGKEFLRTGTNQTYCSHQCQLTHRPWPAECLPIIEEFHKFRDHYEIPVKLLVNDRYQRGGQIEIDYIYVMGMNPQRKPGAKIRRRFCRDAKQFMDRFRAGHFYVGFDKTNSKDGRRARCMKRAIPPLTPVCYEGAVNCPGAIHAGDCPKKMLGCVFNEKGNHRAVIDARMKARKNERQAAI